MPLMALLLSVSARAESVGLVLSGGGAKGIAHIGVIQALEENEIPIDYVTGTSMGAIIGGLYAAGYSPQEMMELMQSPEFAHWSTGVIDERLSYFFDKADPTPAFVTVNLGARDSVKTSSILPSSIISPLPMNFAFMDLFAKYTAQCNGNFDNLFVPFRCVASDVYSKRKVVCRSGSFGDAIRASMSFPVVYHPIEMNGVLMYDGGIYDNFPVDVMREDFAPDVMIGVDVSTPEGSAPKTNDIIDQLEDMIIQNNDYALPEEDGLKLHLNLKDFNILDFAKAEAIFRIGYEYAMAHMDSIKSRIHSRVPSDTRRLRRSVFKSKTPYVLFDSVSVTGGTKKQNDYIRYLFTNNKDEVFGMAHAQDAYYRAISSGKMKNLVPSAHYDEADGLFNLSLKADVKNNYNIGVGGYLTSSTNSMIFLSLGYNTFTFNSVNAALNGWVGQSYMAAALDGKYRLRTHVPSYLRLQVVVSRQKFYESENLFYQDDMPTFITSVDNFGRLSYAWAVGRRGRMEIGAGGGFLSDKFYPNGTIDYSKTSRDYANYKLGQVRALYEYSTLDNNMYPSSGSDMRVTAMGVHGIYNYRPFGDVGEKEHLTWVQAEVNAQHYFSIGRHFAVGGEVNAVYSTKKLLCDYTATIVQAPSFNPTPSSYNAFNPAFRSYSYVTAGLCPIWKLTDNMQVRGEFHGFMPMRKILQESGTGRPYYGRWFSDPEFFGELAVVYNLPFASINLYGNYMSYPAKNWNMGVSFGLFFLAPKLLQ